MNATAIIERAEANQALEAPPSASLSPMQMVYQLIAAGASPDSVEKMMALSERLAADTARRAFDAAMSEARAEIQPITKNREVDFTSSKGRTHYRHEDLGEIARVVDPVLARHGLSYRFRTEQQEGGAVRVVCIVAHRDGHSVENALVAGRDESGNKNNIQAIGSTITYLQRYTLKAALGLAASNDDDGQKSDAGELISEDQELKLRDLLEETKAGRAAHVSAFLKYMKVDALAAIRAKDYAGAVEAINSTRVAS